MRLTRRGWAVLAVVLGAVLAAGYSGARELNAIAVPGVIVLLAAAVQLVLLEPPTVTREMPTVAHLTDVVPVRLRFHVESPFAARVVDHRDFGLVADDDVRVTTVTSGVVRYEVECTERGRRRVGPTRIEARDVLGLVSRAFVADTTRELIVRPRVYRIGDLGHDVLAEALGEGSRDRHEFEYLRDYDEGDALRDVHWRSSAKRPDGDLIVKEFSAEEERRTVLIAAESTVGNDDAMADAAASVVVGLLERGYGVGLATREARFDPDEGRRHRNRLLDYLATVDSGPVSPNTRASADVRIDASDDGVGVTVEGRTVSFDELTGTSAENDAVTDEGDPNGAGPRSMSELRSYRSDDHPSFRRYRRHL